MLKKYYLVLLVFSVVITITVYAAGNLYLSLILTLATFLIVPYYITKHAFVEVEQTNQIINSYAQAGFLSGGVVNLLLSSAGILESIRELYMTIQGISSQASISYGQSYNDVVFSGVFSISLFPIIMFVIGGLVGFLASRNFQDA